MNIFEKISENDRAQISDYIESFGGFDATSLSLKAPLNHILRFWDKNKEDLFKVFGGELILTKKVSFNKPTRVLEDDVANMIGWGGAGHTFYVNFDNWARSTANADHRYDLMALMYCETLAANIYSGISFSIPTPDGHTLAINSGCKVSKVLGKIASNFNLGGYEEFRLAHSLCLNQKQLKGELCVSIHPLDYMTMSDNECGWDSCMNWRGPGDYRQGTVEMMNSPYVVVAYLKASEDMETCCGWNWNNKKWRQLFIVTPHIITGIRQYPYNSDELNGITLKWLRELAEKNGAWGPYEENAVIVRNNNFNTFASLGRDVYLSFSTRFMYNDFYNEHLSFISADIPSDYHLCFSGESECMQCGEDISCYDECDMESSCLTCNECEHIVWCSECGERVDASEIINIDGARVCEYCYGEHYRECAICEETHHENYFSPIYIREDVEQTANDLSYAIEVCEDCVNSIKFRKLFGHTENIPYGRWQTRFVVDLENISLEGLDYFDIWDDEDYERLKGKIEARLGQSSKSESNDEI